MIDILVGLAIVLLFFYLNFKEWLFKKEREDYLDYIKAKDSWEYQRLKEVKKKPMKGDFVGAVPPPDLVPIDQATPEEFYKAIKKDLGIKDNLLKKVKDLVRKG